MIVPQLGRVPVSIVVSACVSRCAPACICVYPYLTAVCVCVPHMSARVRVYPACVRACRWQPCAHCLPFYCSLLCGRACSKYGRRRRHHVDVCLCCVHLCAVQDRTHLIYRILSSSVTTLLFSVIKHSLIGLIYIRVGVRYQGPQSSCAIICSKFILFQ